MSSPRISPVQCILAALGLSLVLLAGCSTDSRSPGDRSPTAPAGDLSVDAAAAASQSSGFYPLTLGSLWRYEMQVVTKLLPIGGPPAPFDIQVSQVTHDLIVTEELFGRTYVVELQRTEAAGQEPYVAYVRYRQDRAGLYEADVPVDDPPGMGSGRVSTAASRSALRDARAWERASDGLRDPARRAAYRLAFDRMAARRALLRGNLGGALRPADRPGSGVLPGEILRLDYKMRPGASWTIRPDPLFTSTVEARERLALPVGEKRAYRVRVDSERFGPNDRIHVWYSTEGLLLLTAHFEEEATDEQGNVIGTLIGEDRKEVTFINIAQ
jgi:hypothetical protein